MRFNGIYLCVFLRNLFFVIIVIDSLLMWSLPIPQSHHHLLKILHAVKQGSFAIVFYLPYNY